MTRLITLVISFLIILTACHSKKTSLDQLENDKGLYAVVVTQNGKTIFRKYFNKKTEKDLLNIQSETKSIMAVLTGIAIDKSFVKSVDEPVSDFFPQLISDKDPGKRSITIRHLLNQTSGLQDYEYPELDKWLNDTNPSDLVLEQPLISRPGTIYRYNTAATHLLSGIISKATQMETEKFAEEYLFIPLGIISWKWGKLQDGFNDGGGLSLWMKTEDLASIGQMILGKGQVNSRQIVSNGWIDQLLNNNNKSRTSWGIKNSLHGFCWYSATSNGHNVIYAMGYGGQFLFIIPDMNTVIAVNHNHDTGDGARQSGIFIEKYLPLIFKYINNQK